MGGSVGTWLGKHPAAWIAAGIFATLRVPPPVVAGPAVMVVSLAGAMVLLWLAGRFRESTGRFGALVFAAALFGGVFLGSLRLETSGFLLQGEPPVPGTHLREEARILRAHNPPPGVEMRARSDLRLDCGHRIRLVLPEGEMSALPGTAILAEGRLREPRVARNPYQWDEAARMREAGFVGTILAEVVPEVIRPPPFWHPLAFGERGRQWMAVQIDKRIEDPESKAVVLGILLGMRQGMELETRQAFRRAGSMHLFAVSGLHVGMVVGLLWLLVLPLGRPRRQVALVLIPAVFAYALVTGWNPPAVRAAVMASVLLAGLVIDRPPRLINSLGIAAALLLLANPAQHSDLSFQLTFSVVLALALIGVPMAEKLSAWGRPDPFLPPDLVTEWQRKKWQGARILSASFAFAIAANIGSLPLILHHFNLVTPSAPVVSILLVPVAWCILALALFSLIPAAVGWGGGAAALCSVAAALASFSLSFCQWIEERPGTWFHPFRPPDAAAEVRVLDLDYGAQATLLRSGRNGLLIDVGNRTSGTAVVGPTLAHTGGPRPATWLLTHEDAGHRGGFRDLVRGVGTPDLLLTNPSRRTLDFPAADPASAFHVLFPEVGWWAGRADDRASVWRWDVAGWRVLGLGDAGFPTQRILLDHHRAEVACDILTVGWHAQDIGLTTEFVAAASPRIVVFHRSHHRWTAHPPGSGLRRFITDEGILLIDQTDAGAVLIDLDPGFARVRTHLGGTDLTLPHPRNADAGDGSPVPAPASAPRNR